MKTECPKLVLSESSEFVQKAKYHESQVAIK